MLDKGERIRLGRFLPELSLEAFRLEAFVVDLVDSIASNQPSVDAADSVLAAATEVQQGKVPTPHHIDEMKRVYRRSDALPVSRRSVLSAMAPFIGIASSLFLILALATLLR